MNFEKPYFAVIFKSKLRSDASGYEEMSSRMNALAKEHPGFLGIESSRDHSGFGITVSYWSDMASIKKWKNHPEHLEAQKRGKELWYESFDIEICEVL